MEKASGEKSDVYWSINLTLIMPGVRLAGCSAILSQLFTVNHIRGAVARRPVSGVFSCGGTLHLSESVPRGYIFKF